MYVKPPTGYVVFTKRMKSLILAAGYATRLYPLTQNFPKPLLKVGEFSILDRLIRDVDSIPSIDEHIIVTNHNFARLFEEWRSKSVYSKPIRIIDDGTTTNENRLGAVRDILLVIEQLVEPVDLLVLAGDNVIDFSFAPFVEFARQKGTSCISYHVEPSIAALQKTGVLETDENFRVLAMLEKPQNPPSNYAVPPFYYYRASDLPLLKKALDEGCGFDAPGNLASWLCTQTEMYAWQLTGSRYDIGDLPSYESVCKLFTDKE